MAESTAPPTEPFSIEARILAEQVDAVYSNSAQGITAAIYATFAVAITLWNKVSPAQLMIWLAWMGAYISARYAVRHGYFKTARHVADAPAWRDRMVWVTVAGGLGWGASFLLLPPGLQDFPSAMLVLVALCAGSAGILHYAPIRGLYVKFAALLLFPMGIWMVWPLNSQAFLGGGFVAFAMVLTYSAGARFQERMEEMLRLRFENRDLVERLDRTIRELADAMQEADSARILAVLDREDAQQARAEAEQASLAKTTFLANMSHEIRTPMNAILGFAELLARDASLGPTQREHLAVIGRSGEALLELINGILDLSKVEAGRMPLLEAPLSLHDLARDLAGLFRVQAQRKGLYLEWRCDGDVPPTVLGDEGKLRQVLTNLMGNAIKFTLAGEVHLQIQATAQGIRFVVSDSGPGISLEEQALLFQAFTQTRTGLASHQGTGLGLALSHQLVRLMGGRLEVDSRPGKGATFHFSLRLPEAASGRGPGASDQGRVIGLAPGQRTWTILVADDVGESRAVLTNFLTAWGFQVQVATHGLEAVERWQAHRPDLTFMDMRMPVLNGREATQRIKALSGGQALVVAQSASAFEEELDTFLQAGCDRSLRKPLRIPEVVQVLEELLGAVFLREGVPQAGPGEAPVLGPIPEPFRASLHQACVEGDLDRVREVAGMLRNSHPALADRLENLADTFDLPGLAALHG